MDAERTPTQLFLLRGLAREARHWGEFLDDLQVELPDVEIQTLDLPGMGERARERSPNSIASIAQAVRVQFLERYRPGGRAFIFAVSLGAMVVVEWLRQDDRHIDGVILVNTSFKGYSPIWRRLWLESYPRLIRAFTERDPVCRERQVLEMVSNRPELYAVISHKWADIQRQRPIRPETFLRQLMAASRYAPPSMAPSVPVLLLSSLKDRMVHPQCSEDIARRWRCEMRRHPSAGHDLPLDAGPWVAKSVRNWMEQILVKNAQN